MELVLTRTYFPEGTNGQLTWNGKLICKTIELPWKENERGVSCVPEGKYFIKKRYSAKHGFHFELVDVPSRRFILIHPANNALAELNGCIAPVTKLSGPGLGQPFIPQNMIAAPVGTTHYKLVTAAVEVDFEANTYVLVTSSTDILPWDAIETAVITQTNTVTANSDKPLFLAVGVEYYQDINGGFYPLKNGSFNSLKILKVDSGV